MKVEIITIGDELLNGQVVDTNSPWIAQQLIPLHFQVVQITSIADTREAILKALADAQQRANIVLVTGGLGPTKDDVTKETIASYFDTTLVRDEAVLGHVRYLFEKRWGFADMPVINQQQADVLANAEVLFNDIGTAPGMWVNHQGCVFVFMPGVPFEMKFIVKERLLPRFAALPTTERVHHAYLLTVGIGESHLAREIADIEDQMPAHIHLAYLPSFGLVRLRLTALGQDEEALIAETQQLVDALVERLGDYVVALDKGSFEEVIVRQFTEHKQTLATAESCTGGAIASSITAIPGASAMFNGGAVSYANESKIQVLDVQPQTLIDFGAVSEQTVLEMAFGAQRVFNTDYAVATSGIAGPGGATPDKPVGTVCIAVAGKNEQLVKTFNFAGDRAVNIERSRAMALAMLWKLFRKEQGNVKI